MITPTPHERSEWSRMAQEAYASGRNAIGHKFSAAAATRGQMAESAFDNLQYVYRLWLTAGWKGVGA